MIKSYFLSSGYMSHPIIKTDSGNSLDLKVLPSFLRTLLVMDGTVTKSLEAWFWEKVNIVASHNEIQLASAPLSEPMSGLDVSSGDEVLLREVALIGQETRRVFATAQSTVLLQHLPNDIGESLIKGDIGIGELLRDKELETYRDIFNINYHPHYHPKKSMSQQSASELSGEVVSRSYRIWVNAKPAIIVSEFFPVSLYQESEHERG